MIKNNNMQIKNIFIFLQFLIILQLPLNSMEMAVVEIKRAMMMICLGSGSGDDTE